MSEETQLRAAAVNEEDLSIPRIYTSFAAFEREELRRRDLTAESATTSDDPPTIPDLSTEATSIPASVSRSLALPGLPPALSVVPASSRTNRPRPGVSNARITPASLIALRAEGILEIGCAKGTSVLYVRTRVSLHLLHVTWLPDRQLDDYAVKLAVTWIEDHGLPSCEVAENLGVSEPTLRRALTEAGYARLSPERHAQLAGARSARKVGNRRGRLVRASAAADAGPRAF